MEIDSEVIDWLMAGDPAIRWQVERRKDGTWNLQNGHSGETHFEMERPGQPSRWNTLRALRVLKWWSRLR